MTCPALLKCSAALLIAVNLGACTVLQPYRVVRNPTYGAQDWSLEAALKDARKVRVQYIKALGEHAYVKSLSGLTLLTVAGFGLFYASTAGASTDVLTALGIGAGTSYAGHQFFYSKPRQFIYAAGANAVTCTVAGFEPVSVAASNLARFDNRLGSMPDLTTSADGDEVLGTTYKAQLLHLEALIQAATSTVGPGIGDVDYDLALATAKRVLEEGEAMLTRIDEARTAIAVAPSRLNRSVAQIQNLVHQALVSTEPNLPSLANSLGAAIPLKGGKILGIQLPEVKQFPVTGGSKVKEEILADFRERLQAATREVGRTTDSAGGVVSPLLAGPDEQVLKACRAPVSEAGVTFAVSPTGPVTLPVSAGPARATIALRGGHVPYDAQWAGRTPLEKVKITLGYRPNGVGEVTVDAEQGAPAGRYVLGVSDSGEGRGAVVIKIDARPTPARSGTQPGIEQPTPDPDVKTIQQLLNAHPNVGETIEVSGLFGRSTRSAVADVLATLEPEQTLPDPVDVTALLDTLQTMSIQLALKARTGTDGTPLYAGPISGSSDEALITALQDFYQERANDEPESNLETLYDLEVLHRPAK